VKLSACAVILLRITLTQVQCSPCLSLTAVVCKTVHVHRH